LDEQVLITVRVLDQRDSSRRRNGDVAHQMAYVQPKQRAGYVRDDDLGIANGEHIVAT
jgi:hypothetical protein